MFGAAQQPLHQRSPADLEERQRGLVDAQYGWQLLGRGPGQWVSRSEVYPVTCVGWRVSGIERPVTRHSPLVTRLLLDRLQHDRGSPEHIVQSRRGIGLPARLLDAQRRRAGQI